MFINTNKNAIIIINLYIISLDIVFSIYYLSRLTVSPRSKYIIYGGVMYDFKIDSFIIRWYSMTKQFKFLPLYVENRSGYYLSCHNVAGRKG